METYEEMTLAQLQAERAKIDRAISLKVLGDPVIGFFPSFHRDELRPTDHVPTILGAA